MSKYALALLVLLLVSTSCIPSPTVTPTAVPPVTLAPTAAPTSAGPGRCHTSGPLPDPNCTPGELNPAVTQATISQTICVSGWTATVRPPLSETNQWKQTVALNYNIAGFDPTQYEGDHLIPLELGGFPGAPGDYRNFWDEARFGTPNAADKDRVENFLKAQVCAGKMSLADAQNGIAHNWTQFLGAVSASVESISSIDEDDQ